jgi:hypothetical protein
MVNDRRLNIASQDEVAVKWLFFKLKNELIYNSKPTQENLHEQSILQELYPKPLLMLGQ